jgi:hypothetical protein
MTGRQCPPYAYRSMSWNPRRDNDPTRLHARGLSRIQVPRTRYVWHIFVAPSTVMAKDAQIWHAGVLYSALRTIDFLHMLRAASLETSIPCHQFPSYLHRTGIAAFLSVAAPFLRVMPGVTDVATWLPARTRDRRGNTAVTGPLDSSVTLSAGQS